MPGPYDYTVNIPQPPAQNFLQSLLGIQQLKGLQQQSELSQQAAAIQQQQAQFAQEKQPYELAQMRAAEKSALASAASAYSSVASSKAATDAKNYELTQRKALDSELLGISSDPSKFTPDNIQKIAIRFHNVDPTLLTRSGEMRKNMPDQVKIFGDNVAKNLILTSVTGDAETAIKQLDKSLEAANNTPELKNFVPQLEALKKSFIDYPDQTIGLATVGQTFFSPDNAKAITDVLAKQADIKKTSAEAEEKTWQGALAKWKAQNAISGKADPEQVLKEENSLRESFLTQFPVRRFQGRIENYDIVKNAEQTTAGDVAKMTAFIKLGDPDSTVSMAESGQLTASNIGEQALKLLNKFNANGGKLTDDMRKQLDSQADSTMRSARTSFENGVLKGFRTLAEKRGLNPENITDFLSPVSVPEKNRTKQIESDKKQLEEERIRGMLRPAAGFGNTMTPSTVQPQSRAVGNPSDVDSILKQFGVK